MKKANAWSLALIASLSLWWGAAPAWGAAAPPLSEVRVFKVESARCSEKVAEGAQSTQMCEHRGPTQVSVMEVGLGNSPMGRFNGAELDGRRTPVCQVGNISEACNGVGTLMGYIYVFDLNVEAQGWFEFSNTSINGPQNTLKVMLNIR
ncbi:MULTISPECIES: DUF4879 domain-containing protein [Pseudomonas]|uniref:DUF4879 domain-containing protein n=1 Tax=Pseudomonas palleroniana TaxID=191390 RepID=A0A1H5AN55_9PSED|nr:MULTISPECIES: DUF4879 domain-containing protein [Pseudomonas]AVE08191.1 DUF4879 domain-containing protein [Pseudomonas palleroniana]KAB0567497.1 DUF4879 domain-containing protein [Pseudomonas palleroniana]MBM9488226.1 DUF4879 domain-containing protein [Pseudomonas sp. ICBG1301]NCE84363.1 DUF4879 domain-containing protein [Pseudomonas sp. Q1]PTC24326.1 DUF4879 domain-containing protein [Pseudomonas palleroniana]